MKRKKKIIIISILGILTVLISGIIYVVLRNRVVDDNSYFTLIDKLETEVYSDKKISDYIKEIKGKIIEDKKINTEKIGEQEITFLYYNNKKRKFRGTFKITIIDNEEPLIWLSNSYSVKVGSDMDLEKTIMCVDNYDENPLCKIEGEYNLNEIGEYPLSFIAKDSSNNENKVDFILQVYNPSNNTTSSREESQTLFSEIMNTYKNEENEIGLDVSKWQEEIDFHKVKQEGASFVMIRVGSQKGVGEEYVLDPYFTKNIENAQKENLKVGVYFYSYADSIKEAKRQAKWVIKQIKKYQLDLPVVFDWECYSDLNEMELSLFGLNKIATAFLNTIEDNNYQAMLYGSKNYLNAIWKYNSHDVWLAHYTDKTNYESPYVMWQLCQNGIIDGIEGYVDIDILYNNKD